MNPHLYKQLVYNKGGKNITTGKRKFLQQVVLGKLDSYMQKNQTKLLSHTLYIKINSKWIKDWNVKPETVKLLEENKGSILFDISFSKNFWICLLRQGNQRQKWYYIKLKSLSPEKETINKMKRTPTEWEKISEAIYPTNMELICKIYKEPIQFSIKKTSLIKKQAENLKRHFPKEDIQKINRQMKTCSRSLIIMEIQIKYPTSVIHHLRLENGY